MRAILPLVALSILSAAAASSGFDHGSLRSAEARARSRRSYVADAGAACNKPVSNFTNVQYWYPAAGAAALRACYEDPTQASCWVPRQPVTRDSTIAFDQGLVNFSTHAVYGAAQNLIAKNILVGTGATLVLSPNAIIWAQECVTVNGRLIVSRAGQKFSPDEEYAPQGMDFPPTPPKKEGDYLSACGMPDNAGGFMPRMCGPGTVYVNGQLDVYIATFAPTVVGTTGVMRLEPGAAAFNAITNYGKFYFAYSDEGWNQGYFHGALYNHGEAYVGYLTFVQRQFAYYRSNDIHAELILDNWGTLNLYNPLQEVDSIHMNTNSTSTLLLQNFGTFEVRNLWPGVSQQSDYELVFVTVDVINDGNMTISRGPMGYRLEIQLNNRFLNTGTLTVNGTAVSAIGYTCVLCTVNLINYGQFYWSPPQMARAPRADLVEAFEVAVATGDGAKAAWYYNYPTTEAFDRGVDGRRCETQRPLTRTGVTVADVLSGRGVHPAVRTQRFAIDGMNLVGDGTGVLRTTVPVFLPRGRTIAVEGVAVFFLVEFGQPLVYGGGTLRVGRNGNVTLGLDGALGDGGRLVVEAGGAATVPLHGRVALSNFTVAVECGGTARLNGCLGAAAETALLAAPGCSDVGGAAQRMKRLPHFRKSV